MLALPAGKPERLDRLGGIIQQPLPEFRIAPRPGHDTRPVARPDLGLIGVDQHIQCRGIDVALFDQQRLQRLDPQRRIAELGMIVIVIIM